MEFSESYNCVIRKKETKDKTFLPGMLNWFLSNRGKRGFQQPIFYTEDSKINKFLFRSSISFLLTNLIRLQPSEKKDPEVSFIEFYNKDVHALENNNKLEILEIFDLLLNIASDHSEVLLPLP